MFSKKSSRANDTVPRRRRVAEDDQSLPADVSITSRQNPATPKDAASNSQFKRNRTLSSYRHNTPEESSRQQAHTLAKQRRRLRTRPRPRRRCGSRRPSRPTPLAVNCPGACDDIFKAAFGDIRYCRLRAFNQRIS